MYIVYIRKWYYFSLVCTFIMVIKDVEGRYICKKRSQGLKNTLGQKIKLVISTNPNHTEGHFTHETESL